MSPLNSTTFFCEKWKQNPFSRRGVNWSVKMLNISSFCLIVEWLRGARLHHSNKRIPIAWTGCRILCRMQRVCPKILLIFFVNIFLHLVFEQLAVFARTWNKIKESTFLPKFRCEIVRIQIKWLFRLESMAITQVCYKNKIYPIRHQIQFIFICMIRWKAKKICAELE